MPCCNPYIETFFKTPSTTINYGPAFQSQYGDVPKVSVFYWDGLQYVAAGIFTSISFVGYPVTQIVVNHGSDSATGVIKIA